MATKTPEYDYEYLATLVTIYIIYMTEETGVFRKKIGH